ncbi:MAG: Maf family protein, partial [Planctomycetes bacterium]|nr:Maf family protein [Planctomycetota bacterium]
MPESPPVRLVLASASARRHELLRQIGVAHRRLAVDVDETLAPGEAPDAYVLRLARLKAQVGAERAADGLPVLGADTAVVVDGEVLGKPADGDDAGRMLRRLAGRE